MFVFFFKKDISLFVCWNFIAIWKELLENSVIIFDIYWEKTILGQHMLDFESNKCWQLFLQLGLFSFLMLFKETSFLNVTNFNSKNSCKTVSSVTHFSLEFFE